MNGASITVTNPRTEGSAKGTAYVSIQKTFTRSYADPTSP